MTLKHGLRPSTDGLRAALAVGASVLAIGVFTPVFAQQTDTSTGQSDQSDQTGVQQIPEDSTDSALDDADVGDTVVVTGSRLRKNSFSSISPIQVISGDFSRDIGLVDTAAILQDSTAATGQQIDQTFNGFVLDNGPGASTVSLRGLGADRSLVLIDGRRVAPAGVEGAPSSPDLNLIPSILVERYEILLDGASSVYGSDAVAGVANVILKKDFDGLRLEGFRSEPTQGGGENTSVAASWGVTSDRGFAGFGIEYRKQQRTRLSQRRFSQDCAKNAEITPDGQIRRIGLSNQFNFGMRASECTQGALAGRIFVNNPFGSIYYDPAHANTGIGDFSESSQFGLGVDADGDGQNDVDFRDFSLNGPDRAITDLFGEQQTLITYAYGEYNLGGANNITPYYEASYANRQSENAGGPPQLFPDVPADNPFNPCNPNGVNGVDCGAAWDAFLSNPNVDNPIANAFGLPLGSIAGIVGTGPTGAIAVEPIISVRGDRDSVESEVTQARFVGGFRGDLPQLEFGPVKNLAFDIYGSYSRSSGQSIRRGILEDRLVLSLETTIEDPNNPGNFVCGLDVDGDGVPDPGGSTVLGGGNAPDCVPVNLFAPSLYSPLIGDFATQAERDFLFGRRTFNTVYEQTVLNGFVSGDVYELPAGTVTMGIGGEFRHDAIHSTPSDSAEDGTFFGFFQDGGANGGKNVSSVYGEIDIPLLANMPFVHSLDVNGSGRYTHDQFYGTAWTYSGKVGYRPVDWLLLRGTYGTSFRAPNLRELFLAGQTGFLTLVDPCVVPQGALAGGPGGNAYDPSLDTRDQVTLDNCRAAGLDPTTLGIINGTSNQNTSTEIKSGGTFDLDPETSKSWTAGFAFEQPWFDSFDFKLSMTYWSIDVSNSIAEPSSQFIINDCYTLQANLQSAFCSRITRGADQRLSLIDAGFINVNSDETKGVDINLIADKSLVVGGRDLTLTLDLTTTFTQAQETRTIGDDGTVNFDDNVGEFANPEWNGRYNLFADYGDFRFTWSTRFIGAVSQDSQFVDGFDDVAGSQGTGFIGDTCLPGDCVARDIGFAHAYFKHDISLRYSADTWTARVGVRNLFDRDPPLVDGNEVFDAGTNAPIGAGYDLQGRTVFVNVSKQF